MDRAAKSVAQDSGTYMTSEEMYRHLNMLANLISKPVCFLSATVAPLHLAYALLQNRDRAGAPLWIDAILFRVSAILSGNKSLMLNTELPIGISVPGQTHSLKFSGTINFAAFTTDAHSHDHGLSVLSIHLIVLRFSVASLLDRSGLTDLKLQNLKGSFIVTEAKQEEVVIYNHVPQAVAEIYASAKDLKCDLVFCSCLLLMCHICLANKSSVVL